jgi:hypothetical protein
MISLGAGLAAMGAGEVVNALGGLASSVINFFTGNDPIKQLTKFGDLAEPLGKAAPALKDFASSFKEAMDLLNNSKLDTSFASTMEQVAGFMTVDKGGGLFDFSGRVATATKIKELADSLADLATKTQQITNPSAGRASNAAVVPALNPSDFQKRTLGFYDNQRESNASFIALLQAANGKLDIMNDAITDGHASTVRAIKSSGKDIY